MSPNEETLGIEVVSDPSLEYPGPILLLAGPGTGKTHQLALRIKDLVETKDVDPAKITVITFTKEAAENMRARIADEEKADVYLDPDKRPSRITTMHSLALGVLRAEHKKLGLPEDFRVMTNSLLRRILFRDAAFLAGASEKEAKTADLLRQEAEQNFDAVSKKIEGEYESILRANNAIDYDDQISLACALLEDDEAVRARYAAEATHLLVDEYQDINPGQRKLIELLSRDHPEGLFVVGDDDQSIYSFRGGNPRYIRKFQEEFGASSRILGLVQSRRCPEVILKAALGVVERFDDKRIAKPEPSFGERKTGGAAVCVHSVASDAQEAHVIGRIVSDAVPKNKVLILIPAKQYAETIKQELRKRHIYYRSPTDLDNSGLVLLEMLHHWCEHPDDNFALRLAIDALCESGAVRIPSRKSRKAEKLAAREDSLGRIAGLWSSVRKNETFWDALEQLAKRDEAPFVELHAKLEPLKNLGPKDVSDFLARGAQDLRPWANRDSLMKEIRRWLEELRGSRGKNEGEVKIMTLQAAKGLEADVVCVVGLDQGVLPRANITEEAMRETGRLVFVSMSRASDALHLFHARKRDASVTYLKESFRLGPSPFLEAIDLEFREDRYHPAPSRQKKRGSA